MQTNQVELNVLIKGRPISEFRHNGRVYVEGRNGSNFELEVKNNTNSKIEAVISVDGLSVIDGKEAGPTSSGYIVDAMSKVVIPGWKLNLSEVAKFEFAGKNESYTASATGSTKNIGVIGLLAYKEKVQYRHIWTKSTFVATPQPVYGGVLRGVTPDWQTMRGSSGGGLWNSSITQNSIGATLNAAAAPSEDYYMSNSASAQGTSVNNLGTGFGAATEFQTTTVSFERGDLQAMIVMYYDNARGLTARGIDLRPSKRRISSEPEAFPGMSTGCIPPKNWRG